MNEILSNYIVEQNQGQIVFRFPNNFGASIIRHPGSYGYESGLFELAVLFNNDLCYKTPITDDVIGWLKEEDCEKILFRILSFNRFTLLLERIKRFLRIK